MINKLVIFLLALTLSGCNLLQTREDQSNKPLGERDIKYYADKTLTSLEIPPDLTKPDSENAFRLSEYAPDIEQDVVSFQNTTSEVDVGTKILAPASDITVQKSGNRLWLVVDKKPEQVWDLSRQFLKSNGFVIKKSNQKIGIMETDYLESVPDIPDQSLGMIRSFFKRTLKSRYALPILDKYRISIEPSNGGSQSIVYLSLYSVEEVVTAASADAQTTIWQSRPKDRALETEMLYRLMLFLGGDYAVAKQKIIEAKEQEKFSVKIEQSLGGYSKLVFPLNRYDTWENVGWALSQLDIDIEDKDIKEGSFYVKLANIEEQGFLSRLLKEDGVQESFQILVKQVSNNKTEVYFNDLTEKNAQETIDFSREFLANIAKQF